MSKVVDFFAARRGHAAAGAAARTAGAGAMLEGFSIEVMPRTAAKIDDFRAILPAGTRVYVAHIDGTPFEEMLATAKRLAEQGFPVMPHFPARVIRSEAELREMLAAYRGEAGVDQGLLIGGGPTRPNGDFDSSMQLLETGLFDGFRRIHVAGHPEGNRDIDADGGEAIVMEALRWKQAFADRSDAEMAIATQFAFDAAPVLDWGRRVRAAGVRLPIHLGVAGPAKLQTLVKFALACGVGPSLQVLQRRAADLTKLMLPFTPEALLAELAAARAADPEGFPIEAIHVFPLGGIGKAAEFVDGMTGRAAAASAAV